ncbi:unnamed protein product [Schistosoma intercalatum]|nr:unnamed protein product [Schistosoma intercalatum]CAH8569018.1 unnamed protein product [Schistosoma intercalatum]
MEHASPETKSCISREIAASQTCLHCCLKWSEECILLASSSNRTISSVYFKSASESAGRLIPEKSDDESVISKSMSMTKLNKNEESGQPLEVTNFDDSSP